MNYFLYTDRDCIVTRLDPRTKLFILLVFFILSLLFENPAFNAVIILITLSHAALGKCLDRLSVVWKLMVIITLFSIIIWTFSIKGITPLWGFTSVESILYGLSAALQINSIIVAGVIFLSTTRNEDIGLGLIELGVPYRLGFAFTTALRLVPTFVGTTVTVIQAQRSRGFDPFTGSIIERIKKFVPLLGPVFLSTLRNADTLSRALESRGFARTEKRTQYRSLKAGTGDLIASIIAAFLLAAALYLKFEGYGKLEGIIK